MRGKINCEAMTLTHHWLRQKDCHQSKVRLACTARPHLKQTKTGEERVTEMGMACMEYTMHML